MDILSIEHLTKVYGTGEAATHALDDVSFTVQAGDFIAIVGASGSGKSTLMHLIGGVDRPTSGTVRMNGEDIFERNDEQLAIFRRREVGLVYQFYNLIPVLRAVENVELPLHLTGLSRRERREHAETALRMVNLEHRMDHYPKELSGGEQQRVAIARAIVTDPALLVADEPTGDLDRVSAEEILTMMERLNGEMGKTIVMVTHDPRAAKRAKLLRLLDKGYLNNAPDQDPR